MLPFQSVITSNLLNVFFFIKFDYLRSKTVGAIDLPINKDTLYIVYTVEVCHEA